ncbi:MULTISPECIES: flagellar biosynthetic protein FliR [unclassified Leisingera]|uniref:flagellar biosynthetic protein FliR n=1 Tax=unclassified Leisingera TaxID=2614906 RepID=UPI0002D938B7|nr:MULTISPECIES: flagellar biosynthetic protein FliR [unclassified Leisingera]KIC24269.1 flagellar biosynthesis protein FliR [Leisingera sp. ANG-S3]KIC52985.1 flagellar biosynthesis protein FliR [Leisingera sp. ANG-S]KID10115.1 flagellar biosynthesis protein FliR [Leisingera sp. ANG1]
MNMNFLPPELVLLLGAGFWHAAIVFLRVSAMVSVLPAMGELYVPTRVKLAIAVAFTFVVAPALPPFPEPDGVMGYARFAVTEAIIGLALGIGARIFVLALQTAGTMAAQSTSLSQVLGGIGAEPMPALGAVLMISGVTLAVMLGLHVRVAELLIGSYRMFPAGQFPAAAGLTEWGVFRVSESFSMAFTLAAPFVITAVIYNLALGVINRAMPQLMVAMVGAPVITFFGLFILMVGSPMILDVWSRALMTFLANPAAGMP